MTIILYLAEAFFVAYFMRQLAFKFKMPAVSGYVIGGVVLGGSLFVNVPGAEDHVGRFFFNGPVRESLDFITHIALGTISLTIGAELTFKRLKSLGISIFAIALMEAFGAFLLVFGSIYLYSHDLILAVILGAVSSATAPAATVAVIQQYRAKGNLTNTILAVVGFDDAISFMLFAFALTVGKGLLGGESITIVSAIFSPALEILISLALGSAIGFIAARLLAGAGDREGFLFLIVSFILLVTGLAELLEVSELLACMACGAMIVNSYPTLIPKIRSAFSAFIPLLYAIFFIIGGAHLNVNSLPRLWLISLIYFFARAAGKVSGASLGGLVSHASPKITRYTGFALLPQVGAAIALALVVQQVLGSGTFGDKGTALAENIINILLITTLFTETAGPYLTKLSLFKAGEAHE